MIFRMLFGNDWSCFYWDERGHGAAMHATIVSLSTQYFGFCVLVRRGEIYLQIMETGKIHIDAFVGGGTKEFGREFWKH
jgi:hypothetical protein